MSARPSFDARDLLRSARGWPSKEGYAVLTKDFASKLQDEMDRLYAIEDIVVEQIAEVFAKNITPTDTHRFWSDLATLCGVEQKKEAGKKRESRPGLRAVKVN